jgi:hypothetical protein
MNKASTLKRVENLLSQLSNVVFDDDTLYGFISLDVSTISWLKGLSTHSIIEETCTIKSRPTLINNLNEKYCGQKAKINVDLSKYKNKDIFIAKTLNNLVNYSDNRISAPQNILLFDGETCEIYPSDKPNLQLSKYRKVISLINILKALAEHNNGDYDLIFYHGKKFNIIFDNWDISFLDSDLDGLGDILNLFQQKEHTLAFKSIFVETLANILERFPEHQRFEKLIVNFERFSLQFEESFRNYLADFSFEKVRDEHEEKHREYSIKLTTIFTDIGNKVLVIPVSLFLSVEKIKPFASVYSGNDQVFFTNTAVLFIVLMSFIYVRQLTTHQRYTVDAITNEYFNVISRLEQKSVESVKQLESFKGSIKKRSSAIKSSLYTADFGAISILTISCLIYLSYLNDITENEIHIYGTLFISLLISNLVIIVLDIIINKVKSTLNKSEIIQ